MCIWILLWDSVGSALQINQENSRFTEGERIQDVKDAFVNAMCRLDLDDLICESLEICESVCRKNTLVGLVFLMVKKKKFYAYILSLIPL